MGGKQVSTAAATLPALPAVHSLTTAFFTRVLAMLSPQNTHGTGKPALSLSEQIPSAGWNPQTDPGVKLSGETRLLTQQLQWVAEIIKPFVSIPLVYIKC